MTFHKPPDGHRRGATAKKVLLAACAGTLLALAAAQGASAQSAREHVFVGFAGPPGAGERALVDRHGGTVRFAFPAVNALAVDVARANVGDLAREAEVRYVEQDPVREPFGLADAQLVPSPSNGLYGLITTRAVDAHPTSTGQGVKACVADTGLATTHPDIAPNFASGYDAFGGGSVDVVDDGVAASETHGTHVAGTVLGANNGVGILGVAPGAQLHHARVLGTLEDGSVSGRTSQIMAGVQWLADQGCKVVNMSLGGAHPSRTEKSLYERLYEGGTLIVASAGNDGRRRLSFPAAYEIVVSVAAVDAGNAIASFSNTGKGLDLSGPGVAVLSSVPAGHGSEASASDGTDSHRAFGLKFAGYTEGGGTSDTLVSCGLAKAASDCVGAPEDGTWVALIERGEISFADKVTNVMAAGADAAVIYNNVAGDISGTLGSETPAGGGSWIPAVAVSDTAGAMLTTRVGQSVTVVNIPSSWDHYGGTSMAAPHVSGVAALVFGAGSNLTPAQVESLLKGTARDLGDGGYDTTYGYGIPQADAAVAATATP